MFLELGADSQLELDLVPESWEEDSSVLLRLGNWWLDFEPYPHFRFPPVLRLSVEQ